MLTTIGLASKNAILIVEFAKENVEHGRASSTATMHAVRDRLRPILMTSLAFGLGVLPLAVATGAGAGGQRAIGTGVFGGMVAGTFLGIFFIPVFFVVVQQPVPQPARSEPAGGGWRAGAAVELRAVRTGMAMTPPPTGSPRPERRCSSTCAHAPAAAVVAGAGSDAARRLHHGAALPAAAHCRCPDQWPIPAITAGTPVPAGDVSDVPPPIQCRCVRRRRSHRRRRCCTRTRGAGAASDLAREISVRDIGWRDFFVDPRLQSLIGAALANNRDLRVAVLNIEKARAQYRVQRSALFPGIDASGSFTREKLPPALTFGVGSFTSNIYQAGVGISNYEIDLFGRVRSLTHAALEQYLAQEEARRSAQLVLIAEVANAYLTLASDKDLQHLAQQTLESQEHSYELSKRSHDAGTTSGLDLAQAQTTVEQARADAARYEGNVAQDIDALQLLVGAPLDPSWLPEAFDAKTMGLEALPAALPSDVLLRRPDVLEAEHALRSANGNIGAARAAFFPSISLTTSIGSASTDLSGLFKAGSGTWAFSPTVTLPLFHGGEIVGNLSLAKPIRRLRSRSTRRPFRRASARWPMLWH